MTPKSLIVRTGSRPGKSVFRSCPQFWDINSLHTDVNEIGIKIQGDKTMLWEINSKLNEVWCGGRKIIPTKTIKHLGSLIQHDLKSHSQAQLTYMKIKQAAARIRALGDVPKKWKLSAYYSWAQSALLYKANTYLPFETSGQISKLQTALNYAIRVALSYPVMIRFRNGKITYSSILKLRRNWRIFSVEMSKTISLAKLS